MAYITGQTTHGCCLPAKYLGNNSFVCEPDIDELHKIHKIYNDYHAWYAKIVGRKGEKIQIRLKWPVFDPDAVSDEYKNWAYYSVDWPPFFHALKDAMYISGDEIHWERILDAKEDGTDILMEFELPEDISYVSALLRYTDTNFKNLKKTVSDSKYVQKIVLGEAMDGSELESFVVTDFDVPSSEKKTAYLHAAQHCHEHPGCHVLDYMIRFLAGESEAAQKIRKRMIFRITPIVDKMGWRIGSEINPERLNSNDFNYNRDWVDFKLPETKAIDAYLTSLKERGEQFVLLADLHGGTGDESDYTSGAGLTVDNTCGDEFRKYMERLVDLIRENCDYINPDEEGYGYGGSIPQMFSGYAKKKFGPGVTFEISMSKIWDREIGHRIPNSQFAFKRFGEQLACVIDKFAYEK
ncbi:MAG: hypothetical protein IKJ65_03995 [Clostridia bacterium]|nr:hypothetical protein [Clostridia bacterium]